MEKMDNSFITFASDILAETDSGLSGMKIVEYFNSYAMDFNKKIPHSTYPFQAPNKRTAFRENLSAFEAAEQFRIIKELCESSYFENSDKVKDLKIKLRQTMLCSVS